jgi:hypothetical protein
MGRVELKEVAFEKGQAPVPPEFPERRFAPGVAMRVGEGDDGTRAVLLEESGHQPAADKAGGACNEDGRPVGIGDLRFQV